MAGRPKLDLTPAERYQRQLERARLYKRNRYANDPEYVEKCKEYHRNRYHEGRKAYNDTMNKNDESI